MGVIIIVGVLPYWNRGLVSLRVYHKFKKKSESTTRMILYVSCVLEGYILGRNLEDLALCFFFYTLWGVANVASLLTVH